VPSTKSISLRDIAQVAGVSVMTVSRALRNNRHVSKPEAKRIRQLASQMGYSLNPYLSSWMRQVRRRRHIHDQEVIAFITFNAQHENFPWQKSFRAGAIRFASHIGYQLNTFALDDYPNASALFRTLRNRGIRGVILALLMDAPLPPEIWQHSLVCWHRPRDQEKVDFVDIDYYEGMVLALEKLTEYGYSRIGYWAVPIIKQHRLWEAAYAFHQMDVPAKNRLPVLRLPHYRAKLSELELWLKVHRPDAIICSDNSIYSLLKSAQSRIPQDLAWASLGLESDVALAGINQHLDMVGEAAARMVTRKMELNEIGSPNQPRTVIVQPEWQDGPTVEPGEFSGTGSDAINVGKATKS
jgi:DNA-binding LacI/PurR family transcriptional regulator